MTLEVIVEGVVTAIEILHVIVFFEAANDNGHSIPYSPNQGLGRAVCFARGYEFSKTLQFAPGPFDLDPWQDEIWSPCEIEESRLNICTHRRSSFTDHMQKGV